MHEYFSYSMQEIFIEFLGSSYIFPCFVISLFEKYNFYAMDWDSNTDQGL